MQPTILRNLGEKLGQVLELEQRAEESILVNLQGCAFSKRLMPLEKGIWASLEDLEEETCILILYEKLPSFCNARGRLGHLTKDCEDKLLEKTALKYNCWIRAPAVPAGRISGNLRNRK